MVQSTTLNVRSAPSLNAGVVEQTYYQHPITIVGEAQGDSVSGNTLWYKVDDGGYVSSALVSPFVAPNPAQTFQGHWVDVNLTQFYAIAYNNSTPVYAAIITAGDGGSATPTGVFKVLRRVRNETMDSATVGIPKGHPGYYYLTNVQYTQYFKDGGYALHQNYWTPPYDFGGYSTNGCVGLLLPAAQWFWNYLTYGSTVSIHK